MKKLILIAVFLSIYQFAITQNQTEIQQFADSTQTIKEINFYEDTLWVMDSSYSYSIYDWEFQLTGTFEVLTRDKQGNKLTALGRDRNLYSALLENSYRDSVFYFINTSDLDHTNTYSWNNINQKWMDNEYWKYNENTYVIEQYNKGWNRYENQYENGSRITIQYINDLPSTIILANYLPESGIWEPFDKGIYYYNIAGKDSILLRLKWNIANEQWVNQYLNEKIYNDILNLTDSYKSYWEETLSIWINDTHGQFTYNENNQMDTSTYSVWDNIENKWVFDRRIIDSYNASGQVIERLTMFFNNPNGNWINDVKYDHAYDELRIESIRYEWDTINGLWIPDYRDISSHTSDSTTFTRQYDNWDSLTQQWMPSLRIINEFDVRLNQTGILFQIWDNTPEIWIIMQQTDYFWSPFNPLDVNEFELTEFKVYPNPAQSSVTFSYTLPPGTTEGSIEIRNLAGQRVAAIPLNQAEDKVLFDTSKLPPGIYIYTLKTARAATTGKLVVTR